MEKTRRSRRRLIARALGSSWVVTASLLLPEAAFASLLSPELEDKLATFIAIAVLFIVPVTLIVLFWMVHVLPEKIAHKRGHPQFEAIRTLCLLSLVFGGLLWPIAWIWAYSKPVLYKMAYGTDTVHHDDDDGHGEAAPATATELRERLARLEARGLENSDLRALQADIEALESKVAEGAR